MYLEKMTMHRNRRSEIGRRAWNILRLALLWARKGGVFKNRLMMDLRLLPKFIIKNLRNSNNHHQRGALHYGDRELSFDDTPVIHVRMHRPSSMRFKMPHIPCINPHVDFDYDFGCSSDYDQEDDNVNGGYDNDDDDIVARKSFLMAADHHRQQPGSDNGCDLDKCEETDCGTPCDEGIDSKAEEFIARFYQQMKLQRQMSYLQYTEMISRGAN